MIFQGFSQDRRVNGRKGGKHFFGSLAEHYFVLCSFYKWGLLILVLQEMDLLIPAEDDLLKKGMADTSALTYLYVKIEYWFPINA